MRSHRLIVLALIAACSTTGPATRWERPAPAPASPVSVDSLLASLSVRQKVGQLIVPWLSGV
jgi:hypothetical protein